MLGTRTTKSIPYLLTLGKDTLSQYIRGECTLSYYFAEVHAVLLLYWAIPSINTLLWYTLPQYNAGNTQYQHIAEVNPTFVHCWVIPNFIALMSYSESFYIVDVHHVFIYCWVFPNLITLLRHESSYYKAELFPILRHRWGIPCLITLLIT